MFRARHNHLARNRIGRKEREQVEERDARGGLLCNRVERNLPGRRHARGIIGGGFVRQQIAFVRAVQFQILGNRLAVRFDVRARLFQRQRQATQSIGEFTLAPAPPLRFASGAIVPRLRQGRESDALEQKFHRLRAGQNLNIERMRARAPIRIARGDEDMSRLGQVKWTPIIRLFRVVENDEPAIALG